MLELEGVIKRFSSAGEEVRAVDHVSLRVDAGEMVALHGPSGSGKTTLLLLIAGLLPADGGTISYAGRALSALSEAELSRYLLQDVGFVHQSSQLMPRVSAVENASLKLLLGGVGIREAQARAVPWLERLGLGDRLSQVTERLSGGERQRVAIARALAAEPTLILADEPTGNLDSRRSGEVIELLHGIAHSRGAAVVLVTHDVEAAWIADRSYALRDGRLLEHDRDVASQVLPSPWPSPASG